MPHEIANIRGTWQAWFADQPAWHGLGVTTPGAKKAEQVIKAVPAFQRPVMTTPIFVKIGKWIQVPDRVATYRRGDNEVLGIVSTDYERITDADAVRTAQAIITAANERRPKAAFVSAGLLGRGERAFCSIDLSKVFGAKVKRDPSRHETYAFATWAHDGTEALSIGAADLRIVCANTRRIAVGQAESRGLLVHIRHTGDTEQSLKEARRALGFVEEAVVQDTALMNALQQIPVKPKLFLPGFVEYVVPSIDDPENHQRAVKSRDEARAAIKGLVEASPTLVGVPMSAYRAYQAVIEYGDHHRPLRIGNVPVEQAADKRFRSLMEGPVALMKDRALEYIRQEFEVPELVPVAVR